MVGSIYSPEARCHTGSSEEQGRKTAHKYEIELPESAEHALEIDCQNGSHLWRDAIAPEKTNIGVALEVLDEGQHAPVGWKKQSGHIMFDVKMDLVRKALWALDGHKTQPVAGSMYAGVVLHESV